MGDYIRVFASTDGGAVSNVALEYVRSLIRIAPVRLVSVSGLLHKSWGIFERLLTTDMSGTMLANVVITEPSYWVKHVKVPMPDQNVFGQVVEGAKMAAPTEVAETTIELYTDGVRNVIALTAGWEKLSVGQRLAALRYELRFAHITQDTREVPYVYLPVPVGAHHMLKHIVLGPPVKEI